MTALKIGLFGGAFDPIHHGHMQVAQTVYDELGLDKLFFIPSFASLDNKLIQAFPLDRVTMCKLVTEHHLGFEVSDFEINQKNPVYTKDTIAHFRTIYPNAKLYWIMGQDQAMRIHTWHDPEAILDLATLAIYPRQSFDMPCEVTIANKHYCVATDPKDFDQARIIFLNSQPIDHAASSLIKTKWNDSAYIQKHLNKKVIEYIQTHKLYQRPFMNTDINIITRIHEILDNAKAENIVTLPAKDASSEWTHMIICTATSQRHVNSLCKYLSEGFKALGISVYTRKRNQEEWIVVDAGAIIIHVMTQASRDFYSLEELWQYPSSSNLS
jgi:nicotinate-nucleotide adenylyltransferase